MNGCKSDERLGLKALLVFLEVRLEYGAVEHPSAIMEELLSFFFKIEARKYRIFMER